MPSQRAKRPTQQATIEQQIRVAIYLRVSTEEQARGGFGLEVQRERCTAQAVAKGWAVVAEFSDEGISGTIDAAGRPGLTQLLAAVEAGEIDAVIVLALDRLGRKTRIILDLVERIADAGADLVSCRESLDTTTPAGRFVLTIFAALAQLERDNIVERTTSGRDARGRLDGEKGGRLPYGYRRRAGGIEIDKPATLVVRTIFKLRKQRKSLRVIIAALGDVPPPIGDKWHASSVRSILQNEAIYRGGRRGDSAVCWPRIL